MTKLRLALLYTFPAALFCSYYPLIPITKTASTNYELSLALIWLFLFAVLSLKDALYYIYNTIKLLHKKPSFRTVSFLLALLFPTYLSLTAIWSVNSLRAIMTAGILWCIVISAIGVLNLAKSTTLNKPFFLKTFLLTSCIFCVVCWLQSLLDVLGISREITLLCPGCVSYSFGFPHPSGLAIEPQFMGNLLLAPTLLSLWFYSHSDINQPKAQKSFLKNIIIRMRSHKYTLLAFFLMSTLFLTFSRGAIYSFLLALAALILANLFKLKNPKILKSLPLLFMSFFFTLLMQGIFSELSYTNSTFASGIESSISQLSLGKINLHLEPEYPRSNDIVELTPCDWTDCQEYKQEMKPTPIEPLPEEKSIPVFAGYVTESTDTRMKFNRLALELAPQTTNTLIFGYGLGSAGEVMYKAGKTTTPYEIIQNEYLSVLLETGLLGLLLAALAFVVILSKLKNHPERYFLGAVVTSFLFSLLFFSGLPNAAHLYLFPVFLAVTLPSSLYSTSSRH